MPVRLSKKQLIVCGVVSGFLMALTVAIQASLRHEKPDFRPTDAFQPNLAAIIAQGDHFYLSPQFFDTTSLPTSSLILPKSDAERASRDPSRFHSLDRERHFSVALLSRSGGISPLGKDLLSSPLWTMTDVAPWGYQFERLGAKGKIPWSPPSQASLAAVYPQDEKRTLWLVGTAENLVAIGRNKEAEQLLSMAAKPGKFPSRVLGARASLAASQGQWNEAMTLAGEAVAKDSANDAAREILIRALTESNRPDEALSEARNLVQRQKNTESLFLLARAANAANSGDDEIASLQELVSLARKGNQPLGASLTYLGQALAKNGQRGEALRAFHEALTAPELTDEERKMIRQLAEHITPDQSSR